MPLLGQVMEFVDASLYPLGIADRRFGKGRVEVGKGETGARECRRAERMLYAGGEDCDGPGGRQGLRVTAAQNFERCVRVALEVGRVSRLTHVRSIQRARLLTCLSRRTLFRRL
jgi:hypothetical protein